MTNWRSILFYRCLVPGFALLMASCSPSSQNQEKAKLDSNTSAKEVTEAKAETPVDPHEHEADKEDHCDDKEESLTLTPEETLALAPESNPVVKHEFVQTASFSGQIYRGAGEASLRHGRERQGSAYASCLLPAEAAESVANNVEAQFYRPPPSTDQFTGSLLRKEDEESGWRAGQRELLWEIKDPALSLQVGEIVTGSVTLNGQPRMALAVPNDAVLTTATGPVVYLHQENYWLRRIVKIGAQDRGWTEILEGLQEADEVAIRSVNALYLLERKKEGGGGHSH